MDIIQPTAATPWPPSPTTEEPSSPRPRQDPAGAVNHLIFDDALTTAHTLQLRTIAGRILKAIGYEDHATFPPRR